MYPATASLTYYGGCEEPHLIERAAISLVVACSAHYRGREGPHPAARAVLLHVNERASQGWTNYRSTLLRLAGQLVLGQNLTQVMLGGDSAQIWLGVRSAQVQLDERIVQVCSAEIYTRNVWDGVGLGLLQWRGTCCWFTSILSPFQTAGKGMSQGSGDNVEWSWMYVIRIASQLPWT